MATLLQKHNFKSFGKHSKIQYGLTFRHPSLISIGNNVNIGRRSSFLTELSSESLEIGDSTYIGKLCHLDFTGGVTIGDNCTISEEVVIYSHDHALNPRSIPKKTPLEISNNVWIGVRAIILQGVSSIGENSIVAAGAIVTKPVPSNVIVAGNPAKIIKNI